MNIGEKLRSIRQSKNITIYRLSMTTGISQNHISGVELGNRQPTVDILLRLIEPLGITPAEFFNEDNTPMELTENEKKLIENYRRLPNEKAEALLNLIQLIE
ncbi:MAG: helix-turn-helix domain-containing protein [Oscillospiraceae bacterium]|nr:helix-turn-helix domain-containing protein [Oscillospiraceae bacterium]